MSRGFMTESFSVVTDACSRVGSCSVRAALSPSEVRARLVVFSVSAGVTGSPWPASVADAARIPVGGGLETGVCPPGGAMFPAVGWCVRGEESGALSAGSEGRFEGLLLYPVSLLPLEE